MFNGWQTFVTSKFINDHFRVYICLHIKDLWTSFRIDIRHELDIYELDLVRHCFNGHSWIRRLYSKVNHGMIDRNYDLLLGSHCRFYFRSDFDFFIKVWNCRRENLLAFDQAWKQEDLKEMSNNGAGICVFEVKDALNEKPRSA